MNKPLEWIVLVAAVSFYLIIRSKHLAWWERMLSAFVSAGLAYAGSAELAAYLGDSELLAAIVIMLVGPMILNGVMTLGEDEDFLKKTMQAWLRKRLGVKGDDDDPSI